MWKSLAMPDISNPNSGNIHAIPPSSMHDIDASIQSLSSAHSYWWNQSLDKRIHMVRCIQQAIQDDCEELAHVISLETGKPFWESQQEVSAAVSKIDTAIESIEYRCRFPTIHSDTKSISSSCRPFGVIGIIGPFNFPLHLPHGQVIPAFLMGNACVIKPSEYASETMRNYMAIFRDCFDGYPCPIDIATGGANVGDAIVRHSRVAAIFFTGSAQTGCAIESVCHELRKPCALEMGGNNAFILDNVSDDTHVINHIILSAFLTSGQRCSSAQRLIMSKHHTDIIERLLTTTIQLPIQQYPTKLPVFMGPVVLPSVVDKILNTSFDYSSTILPSTLIQSPRLITPRIERVDVHNFSFDDEVFGPLLFIYVSDDLDHSIALANASRFGLTASVYTENPRVFQRCLRELHAGIINWNQPTTGASGMAPFGGVNNSGNFRPGGFSMIDHCYYPIASTKSSLIFPMDLPQ